MPEARINSPDLDTTSGSKLVRYAFNRLLSHIPLELILFVQPYEQPLGVDRHEGVPLGTERINQVAPGALEVTCLK